MERIAVIESVYSMKLVGKSKSDTGDRGIKNKQQEKNESESKTSKRDEKSKSDAKGGCEVCRLYSGNYTS